MDDMDKSARNGGEPWGQESGARQTLHQRLFSVPREEGALSTTVLI